MFRQRKTTVPSAPKVVSGKPESGAAMVEAAIVLPVFLAVMFITMGVALFCYRLLSFQYDVSDLTRQTFISTSADRNNASWRTFLESRLNARAQSLGMKTRIPSSPNNNYKIQFSRPLEQPCEGWECAATARPGDIFSVTVTVTEPIFSRVLANISWQQITMSTKGIAFVYYRENE